MTDVVSAIAAGTPGDKVLLLTAFKQHKNRHPKEELNILLQKGFSRLYVGGETLRIEDLLEMDENALKKKLPLPAGAAKAPAAFILVDRLVVKAFDEDDRHRIADSVNTAFYEGEGEMLLEINGKDRNSPSPTVSNWTA